MTGDPGDAPPIDPEAEAIAGAYEEEAALSSPPNDLHALSVRLNKIEERLATIEDYLGTPPSHSGTLEERLSRLGGGSDTN
jgi:hypothetical protein